MKIIKKAISFTPFDNRGYGNGAVLGPPTQRSVIPTNNVHTIQDVLDGRKYDYLHGGGSWSSGEDVSTSYREEGSDYKRQERDLDILREMSLPPSEPPQKWKVRVKSMDGMGGGSKIFPSFNSAQRYKKRLEDKGVKFVYLSRVAQRSSGRAQLVSDSMEKTFLVESIDLKDGVKEVGSAFSVGNKHFVTCAHVIKEYDRTKGQNLVEFYYATVYVVHENKRIKAEVVNISTALDLALIKCDIDVESFNFGEANENDLGGEVIVVGSPHGFDNNVSTGSLGSIDRKIFLGDKAPTYIFVNAAVFPGNSGAPVIRSADGKVIGMMNFILSADASDYGLNVALPAKYVRNFCLDSGLSV